MESIGAFSDEEWQSFMTKMFTSDQDSDLMPNFHGSDHLFLDQVETGLSFEMPSNFLFTAAGVDDHPALFSSDSLDSPNFYQVSQESSHSNISQENGVNFLDHVINDTFLHDAQSTQFRTKDCKNDFPVVAGFPDEDRVMENILLPKEGRWNIGQVGNEEIQQPAEISVHLKRKSNEGQIISSQRKKNKKVTQISTEDPNGEGNGRSSSSCSSVSQELNGGRNSESKSSSNVNSNGKGRAGRGSASDLQSLYAMRRREKINERLRILQNLVPNGTKVDISTMLEEAVHYVKFLQLQIKLLSSDDLWMYAPIAYNGMDIGLYNNQKISLAPC